MSENSATKINEVKNCQDFPSIKTATLLCDASTVMAIQLSEAELKALNELKVSEKNDFMEMLVSPTLYFCSSNLIHYFRIGCL